MRGTTQTHNEGEGDVDRHQEVLSQLIRLADRVTMARLGLLKELTTDDNGGDVKVQYAAGSAEEWEQYLAYFRQTFAYLAASVRDGNGVLEGLPQRADIE